MDRLKQFKPAVRRFVPAGVPRAAFSAPLLKAGVKWYRTSRWQKLRWSVLVRDLFTCQLCQAVVSDTSQLVCDHIDPHRGDETAFWAGPFQCLCKPCHDSVKQRQERAGR